MTDSEKQDLKTILTRKGTQPLSAELEKWVAESEGFVGTSTLQTIARSFKGKRASEGIITSQKSSRLPKSGKSAKTNKPFDLLKDLYKPLLLNMGFEASVVTASLSHGVRDLN